MGKRMNEIMTDNEELKDTRAVTIKKQMVRRAGGLQRSSENV